MRHITNILAGFLFVVCSTSLFAQVRTVTFTGRDRTNQYHIPLTQVTVFNLDQLWEEVLYYPDTVLVLGSVGVEDYETGQNLQLMQNVPNPFDGTTEFALQLPENRDVLLEIYDITGKLAVGQRFSALSVGTHLFQATLSSPQTYLLSAKVDNGQMTIKMVNTGHGAGNTIRHLGMTDKNGDFTIYLKNDQAYSGYPFHVGDEMQYMGSAVVDGMQLESAVVTQAQVDNETVPLLFDITAPTVITNMVSNVTTTTAEISGNVTSMGGSPVTARGVCVSISQNPTVNDWHTVEGGDLGMFISSMTELTPNTTYYVRAYAINSVGTGYGEQRTFTTACDPVNVSAVGDTTINYGQSATLTASGANSYLWSTGATTESVIVNPTSTTTYTVTGADSYGCTDTASVLVTVNPVAPSVTTNIVSNITEASATCGGSVTSDGGALTYRGVCWSTSQNPTVSDFRTNDGSGTGTFTSNITRLTPNTTYYVRAYAINSVDTTYGQEVSFTTCTNFSVTISGNTIVDNGLGATVVASGAEHYLWSTGDTSSTIILNPAVTTWYSVEGTDMLGCKKTVPFVIYVVSPVEVGTGLSEIEIDCSNQPVALSVNTDMVIYNDYKVDSIQYNPPFNFTDGNTIYLNYDDKWASSYINLPFLFNFYGYNYNQILPGSNSIAAFSGSVGSLGYVLPGTTCAYQIVDTIPSLHIYTNAIFACYRDIYNDGSGSVNYATSGIFPDRSFMLSFNNMRLWPSGYSNAPFSSMIVLHEGTNIIDIYLKDAPVNTNWQYGNGVLGLQNRTGKRGIAPPGRNTGLWTAYNEAWRFTPVRSYMVTWYLGTDTTAATGVVVGTGDTITVFPGESTYYTARLQFIDEDSTEFDIINTCHVTVNPSSTLIATATQNVVCAGETVVLTAGFDGASANTCVWSTGEEGTSIVVNPMITTTYTVTATNNYGCTDTAMVTVVVSNIPIVSGFADIPPARPLHNNCEANAPDYATLRAYFDANITVALPCSGTVIDTVVFYLGNSNVVADGNPDIFATTDFVTIYAVVTDNAGNTSAKTPVFQLRRPAPMYITHGAISIDTLELCVDAATNMHFNTNSVMNAGDPCTYQWSQIDVVGSSVITSNPNNYLEAVVAPFDQLINTSTHFTMTVTDAYGCVAADTSNAVHFYRLPDVTVSQDPRYAGLPHGDDGAVCPNWGVYMVKATSHSNLPDSIPNYQYLLYEWSGESVNIYSTYDTTGVYILPEQNNRQYEVFAEVTNKKGCSATSSFVVTVRDTTAPVFNGTLPDGRVCKSSDGKYHIPDFTTYFTNQTVSDNCYSFSDLTITQNPAAGTEFYVPTEATITLSDRWGNGRQYAIEVEPIISSYTFIDSAICQSDLPFAWNGHTISESGTYHDTLTAINGCDSIVTLHLIIYNQPTIAFIINDEPWITRDPNNFFICENKEIKIGVVSDGWERVWWSNAYPAGCETCEPVYYINFNSFEANRTYSFCVEAIDSNGCRTIEAINVIAKPIAVTVIDTVTCQNQLPFVWNSRFLTEAGTYYDTLTAVNGCDSVVTLHLTIHPCGPVDAQPCPGTPTVTDVDGNVYNTVQIGGQCWMRENLRTTKYADGTSISQGNSSSYSMSYWSYPNNDASNKETYGLLYNWKAAMRNDTSSDATPSGVQGICPIGWHVPSDAEWKILADYVSGQGIYICGGDNVNVAKALASDTGWINESQYCMVGNASNSNNATGYSAFPAGIGYRSENTGFGSSAYFWSATEKDVTYAYDRHLYSSNARMGCYTYEKHCRLSVRCLHDEENASLLPTLTTDGVSSATTTINCYATVISEGSSVVTARGVCWGTSHYPTIEDNHSIDGNGIGSFNSSITGLIPNLTYYVRAYATNLYGTVYGNEIIFNTPFNPNGDDYSCAGTPILTDIDGNVYNTVQLGGQCWMRENLRTTRYANGTPISQGHYISETACWYYPNGDSTYKKTYGLLYNWPAVMNGAFSSDATPSGVQGVCPDGWHVPSRAEWIQLTDYVGGQSQYTCDNDNNNIAKALSATIGWDSYDYTCSVGDNPNSNNATFFGVLPAGIYRWTSPTYSFYGIGSSATMWSTTEHGSFYAYYCGWDKSSSVVRQNHTEKNAGNAVRCVRDEGLSLYFPMVTTTSVNNITVNSASCGGNVTADGNSPVTARGVCWSTSHNPTTNDNHTLDGTDVGSFSSTIAGLASNITYFVRAYATNFHGTVYGNEVSFTTPIYPDGDEFSCVGMPIITDIDGNIYNTVQIGDQCWMRENLRTTKYSDGTSIAQGSHSSNTISYWFYPNGDSSYKQSYGLLYNWPAVMNGSSFSNTSPSGVQGVCPLGWHVPSYTEWKQLTDYMSSQSQYWCGNNSNYIAKALAATTGWYTSNRTCHVGNGQDSNNSSQFGALPSGRWTINYCLSFNGEANFWCTSSDNSSSPWHILLDGNAVTYYAWIEKSWGFSVRCLRDAATAVIDAKSCPAAPTVTDHEGNVYATVQIGNQCWMRENLRTTTSPSTGTYLIPAAGTNYTYTGKQARWYNNDSTTYAPMNYGLLYNWNAAVDTFNTAYGETSVNTSSNNAVSVTFSGHRRGICPAGWHLPSDAEWTQLTDYVSSQSEYTCSGNSSYIAKALASTEGWNTSTNSCAVGNNQGSNNATGFSAVPAGICGGSSFNGVGGYAYFWSSTQILSDYAWYRSLGYGYANVGRYRDAKNGGFSVRCLRDETCTVVIDEKSCPEAPTVTDHEGNVYATVQIGNQCWMRDNLRTTTSPSTGTYLVNNEFTSGSDIAYTYTGKMARWYNNDSATYAPMNYGLLYNWNAAADTFNTAYGETSVNQSSSNAVSVTFTVHRRGICPAGWHLPSDAEWTQLTNYVSSQSEYVCGDTNINIAKALADSVLWLSSTTSCAVGNNRSANNATGFGTLPAGWCISGFYNGYQSAFFWSSTTSSFLSVYPRLLDKSNADVRRNGLNDSKRNGFSVRCLRDAGTAVIDSKSCPSATTVTDHEGNVYATVQIGNQCWMRDNLRTTTSPTTGTYLIPPAGTTYTYTGKQARWYNNDSTTYAPMNYGLLYNWNAAVDTFNTVYGETSVNTNYSNAVSAHFFGHHRRGICPAGWHLPSDAEWTTMTTYVGNQSEYTCGDNSSYIAKALADSIGWITCTANCAICNDLAANNATGFSAFPVGGYFGDYSFGSNAYFWSFTEGNGILAWLRYLSSNTADVGRLSNYKYLGFSVRCLRDAIPDIIDSKSCPAAPTVTDHEGNVYATVQIGNQCWMRDNLRTTTSPNTGTYLIPAAGTTYTYTGKQARWYNNDSTTYAPMNYGLLYNWNAAVDTFNTTYGETSVNTNYSNAVSVSFTSHRQGICPVGWHLPSDAEWTQLFDYVGQSEYVCGGTNINIAKALASTEGWSTYGVSCEVGNDPSSNNATGFSALPAGRYYSNSGYSQSGNYANFWSATESGSFYVYGRYLFYARANVFSHNFYKDEGYSVRCLRD